MSSSAASPPETHRRTALLALVLVASAAGGGGLLLRGPPEREATAPPPPPPLVRVLPVERHDVRVVVRAHGSVVPRSESQLVAEVSGRVVEVSPAFAAGGFFDAGEVLVRLDSRDYELAVESARALLERRRSEAELFAGKLERARQLAAGGVASPAALDDARNRAGVAAAALREAEIALARARRDLERTRLAASFAGRVRETRTGVGQYVTSGASLARLYAVDYAEVRLPVPDQELAFLELPLAAEAPPSPGPRVSLSADFAGRRLRWSGHVVRSEAEIDARSRMVHLVARVEDPYGRRLPAPGPPLVAGMFLDAEIEGRVLRDVAVVPPAAARGENALLVVDAGDRLRLRHVTVLRREPTRWLVGAGLAAGDRLCLTDLPAAAAGAPVRTRIERAGDPPQRS